MSTERADHTTELEVMLEHICCYSPDEVQAMLNQVRLQAVNDAAEHFDQAHARLGGETYPDDMREYAADKYGG